MPKVARITTKSPLDITPYVSSNSAIRVCLIIGGLRKLLKTAQVPKNEADSFSPIRKPTRSTQDFQAETFTVQVFPPRTAAATANVVLYDSVGDTTKLLQQAGARFSMLSTDTELTPDKLLVIGRRSWDERFLTLAGRADLDASHSRGPAHAGV